MPVNLDRLQEELSARADRQEFSGVVRIDGPEDVLLEEGFGDRHRRADAVVRLLA